MNKYLLLLLLLPTFSYADSKHNWVYTGGNKHFGLVYFMDKYKIENSSNWTLYYFANGNEYFSQSHYALILNDYDCNASSTRTQRSIYYSLDGSILMSVNSDDITITENNFAKIVPNSIEETEFSFFCDPKFRTERIEQAANFDKIEDAINFSMKIHPPQK